MKKLGFGLMRLPLLDPNDEGSINIPLMKEMVDHFMAKGFTYFDTAYMYCGGNSERAIKETLVTRYPRDSFTLTSKLPGYKINSLEDRDLIFNEQREKTGVEYFDYYWLHAVSKLQLDEHFEKYDCFTWLKEKKEQGLVKHIGFSYHDSAALLDEILTKHPEVEYVQLQINYLDWESFTVESRKCYEVCVKHGKQVIVMEPVKGGALANVCADVQKLFKDYDPNPSLASWAIRFVASLENVMVVLSGMSNMEQMLDNTSYMENFVPLTEEENKMCLRAADIINSQRYIQCTGCSYCTVNCPMNICIPRYFSLYNQAKETDDDGRRLRRLQSIKELDKDYGAPDACIGCGQCEGQCPQHLSIRDYLKEIARDIESI